MFPYYFSPEFRVQDLPLTYSSRRQTVAQKGSSNFVVVLNPAGVFSAQPLFYGNIHSTLDHNTATHSQNVNLRHPASVSAAEG